MRAAKQSAHGAKINMRKIEHFIGGQVVGGQGVRWGNVFDPSTGKVQAQVHLASQEDVAIAVDKAKTAQVAWAATNPQKRARVMFAFKGLLERDMEELARLLSSEHGKTVPDAKGDIQRGLEVIEFACGIPHLLKGEFTSGAGLALICIRCACPWGSWQGSRPLTFPAMIPMWMFGVAIACGNAFICKPSEKDPSVPMRLGALLKEAGLPDGIYNVVNGDKVVVDALLEHPDVKAISFVGSSAVAEYIYAKGATYGKRVQAMGGAKNHAIIMPDADLDQVTNDLMGAGYGSAGERCMAISVAVPVTDKVADALVARLKPRVEALKVGPSLDPDVDYGPLISKEHRANVIGWIDKSAEEGAELVVDGRKISFQGYEEGYYLGGSLIDRVTPTMASYKTEIFGPVLALMRADSLEDAVTLINQSRYGNAASIFTSSGKSAREFKYRVKAGNIGVNIGVAAPSASFPFGGQKESFYGDLHGQGSDSIEFFTERKVVIERWT
ncbi:MAG: CoA-acylating methylmalonate-semialdehyde dehydrogenase [Hyphomonadaceae bacterium]|nr:CoA-acylating methylmalonate-semialdehyde dehydrogenase [Hyphomonadaceae bacterium]